VIILRIVLLRHGESVANKDRIIQGHADYPLTEKGISEAKDAAKILKSQYGFFDKIYSSDLIRATETARIVSSEFDNIEVIFDNRLREFDLGIFSNRATASLTQEEKDLIDNTYINHDFQIPEGESLNNMKKRISEALNSIINQIDSKSTILIVGHGGTLYHILHHILGVFPETDDWFKNCSINEIVLDDSTNKWILKIFNDKPIC